MSLQPTYARLPVAPRNGSHVPHLTSLYHFHRAGEYGDRKYPGNCGGNLIKDLLLYFQPGLVFDPMTGSGTCRDVCEELDIPCLSYDIHQGYDACSTEDAPQAETFDFIWAHPAYWRQKLYADDPRDLSRSPTLDHFLKRYGQFIRNSAQALKPGGKMAILMGDYSDREAGFVPLTFHTKRLALAAGLVQHCTDIIRFGHGASSSRKVYRSSFIPGLHDTCMIFEKPTNRKETSMNLNGFQIDTDFSDDEYLSINVDGFTILIKREGEGVVVDIYDGQRLDDEPLASTYAFSSELTS